MNESEYVPSQDGYTIEEFMDLITTELTVACSLPKTLPDAALRQLIETRCLNWFYKNYMYAVQKIYYIIRKEAFFTEEYTRYGYVQLPCEIQTISYLYEVRGESLYQLGINSPQLSVNLGVTNQPFLSAYVSTISELGVYKTILDSMSDMLNQLNKYTVKFHFNPLNHRLNILTKINHSIVVEGYAEIPKEYLFKDELFFKYVVGYAKVQLANMLGMYNITIPGNVTINHQNLLSQGKEEIKEVEDYVKSMSQSSFFVMVKR